MSNVEFYMNFLLRKYEKSIVTISSTTNTVAVWSLWFTCSICRSCIMASHHNAESQHNLLSDNKCYFYYLITNTGLCTLRYIKRELIPVHTGQAPGNPCHKRETNKGRLTLEKNVKQCLAIRPGNSDSLLMAISAGHRPRLLGRRLMKFKNRLVINSQANTRKPSGLFDTRSLGAPRRLITGTTNGLHVPT